MFPWTSWRAPTKLRSRPFDVLARVPVLRPGLRMVLLGQELENRGRKGTYLYLSKEPGAWHIVGRAGTWISQDFEWYDHGTQTKWPELNRIRPAIPAYVSLLNVWSRIEPFTDEASHFALLVNRHLFSTGVVIAEIAH